MASTNIRKQELTAALSAMGEALRGGRLDEASGHLEQAKALHDRPNELAVFDAVLLIQRGDPRSALQLLEAMPTEEHADLKAVCLYLLKDPYWEGLASSLEESDDPCIRRSMKELLGRQADESDRDLPNGEDT
jgi:hypothetical protein